MPKSRAVTGGIVAITLGVASLFAATPANAATLPDGQKITVIDTPFANSYLASPVDASLTAVGAPSPLVEDLQGVDVDDDGLGYAVGTFDFEDEPAGGFLYPYDANTAVFGLGLEVTIDFGDVSPTVDGCNAIDYSAGIPVVSCFILFEDGDSGNFYANNYIGAIDPATGEIQSGFIEFPGDTEQFDDNVTVNAIALDPTSGLLYVFTTEFPDDVLYGVYTTDGDTFNDLDATADEVHGADFDRGGQLWLSVQRFIGATEFPPFYPVFATFSFADSALLDPDSVMNIGGVDLPGQSELHPLTVWGKPTLAATGAGDLSVPVVGAMLLLLAGTILVGVTSRRPSRKQYI